MKVRGKVAIVTGAGAGIGSAVALGLAREGACVVVADIDEDGGSGTVREIGSEGGVAAFFRSDVASEADVHGMVAFAEEESGGLDVLVNNAGGVEEPYFSGGRTQALGTHDRPQPPRHDARDPLRRAGHEKNAAVA
jgi:NAD(P)-dependent dehydrogenase (short-subunit alcohol dehydrogenase family)